MARGILYAVFLLPVLFSAIFGTIVMADILQQPDRELNLWRIGDDGTGGHDDTLIEIIGIQKQYSVSEPVSFAVKVFDSTFSCGDLYITIYSDTDQTVTQSGFFTQCFDQNNPTIPIDAKFSEVIDIPGTYRAVIELTDRDQRNSLVTDKIFTIK